MPHLQWHFDRLHLQRRCCLLANVIFLQSRKRNLFIAICIARAIPQKKSSIHLFVIFILNLTLGSFNHWFQAMCKANFILKISICFFFFIWIRRKVLPSKCNMRRKRKKSANIFCLPAAQANIHFTHIPNHYTHTRIYRVRVRLANNFLFSKHIHFVSFSSVLKWSSINDHHLSHTTDKRLWGGGKRRRFFLPHTYKSQQKNYKIVVRKDPIEERRYIHMRYATCTVWYVYVSHIANKRKMLKIATPSHTTAKVCSIFSRWLRTIRWTKKKTVNHRKSIWNHFFFRFSFPFLFLLCHSVLWIWNALI